MIELVQLEKNKAQFDALNVTIVAVTVEDSTGIGRTRKMTDVSFDFVRDHEGKLMDLFGLRDTKANPSNGPIPRSARVLISPAGKILWLDRSENYRVRPTPEAVLKSLRSRLAS